jgi:hypothetical protein
MINITKKIYKIQYINSNNKSNISNLNGGAFINYVINDKVAEKKIQVSIRKK